MVLANIEELIEKYENGETTLQEEQQLKDYFSQETVPSHLEVYKSMFQYFLYTQQEQFTKDVPLKPRKTYSLYKWISVAAIAVLMFGIYTQVNVTPEKPTYASLTAEEREAYDQTKALFNLLSTKLNKGTENLAMVSSNFDKGANNMAYLGEVSKATSKILK